MSKSEPGGTVTARGGRRKGLSPGVFTVEVIPEVGGAAHSQGSERRQSWSGPQPLHGRSRMGSHSNVNHRMTFSRFTGKTPERTPRSYFLAKLAFSGAKRSF